MQWAILHEVARKCTKVIQWMVEEEVNGDDIVEIKAENLKEDVDGISSLEVQRFIRALDVWCKDRH
jgi:hypothetical protein